MNFTFEKKNNENIKVMGGAVSNDATHISAPSRSGEELNFAIKKADTTHIS